MDLALSHMVNPAVVIALCLYCKKRLADGLRVQRLGQNPLILPGLYIKLIAKN